ncbi:tyrosine-type recombinase/integrase [Dyella acidiphila]|uniref:Site-specific integrase n=1 Tax=Dyella acidiphila TaxID=2775866 RepID=A0ABR9GDJ6_9GAMM|nr:site-specific integrase [Dyella acidiphila]MBE1162124.1 site-specific integrase [Dyella acidiphila]
MGQELRVHQVSKHKKSEPGFLLFSWPSMQLHEDASRWIARLARTNSQRHQRNMAYAIAYWHTYCLTAGIDYRRACADDLSDFGDALAEAVSEKTGRPLSAGTISKRMEAVIAYYIAGEDHGWYLTALDFAHALATNSKSDTAFQTTHAQPINDSVRHLIPRYERSETDIRPLSPEALVSLLEHLGPSEEESGKCGHFQRDRIVAEWMAYVGLRLSEIVGDEDNQGLSVHQFSTLNFDPNHLFDHSIVRVLGKGAKYRNVAVPNWLILRTKNYIATERASAVAHIKHPTSKLIVAHRTAGNSTRGKPITGRWYEHLFAKACLEAKLIAIEEIHAANSNQKRRVEMARHSPHDLRHTYAVMTYFAERELGNLEPWKPIQAQLGHRYLRTTIETYLSYVSVMNEWGRDLRRMSVRELAGVPLA